MGSWYKAEYTMNIRSLPDINSASIGSLTKGSVFEGVNIPAKAIEQSLPNGNVYSWIQMKAGVKYVAYKAKINGTWTTYLSYKDSEKIPEDWNKTGVTIISSPSEQKASAAQDDAENEYQSNTGILEESKGYTPNPETLVEFDSYWGMSETEGTEIFDIRSVLGIFGLPYQFMPHVDPRINDGELPAAGTKGYNSYLNTKTTNSNSSEPYGSMLAIGETFAHHIVSSMPILLMSPGKPNFMGKYSNDEKKSIIEKLIDNVHNAFEGNDLEDLLGENGRYYTFEYTVDEYYKYVNPMCRIAAAYMGVADYTLEGVKLQSLDWQEYTLGKISGIFNGASTQDYLSIPFYIESDTQIQDSFGNDTQESSIASTINSLSDQARELQFLLGYAGSAANIDSIISDPDVVANNENLNDAIQGMMKGNGSFLHNIGTHLVSVASGGKMIFPKIWAGSDFSRSYNVTIKLRSPDMDNLSLYFNIIVPAMHLIGFVAPHMLENDPNSFGNPFIVRAIYKGFFNVDMGIITSMSLNKGDTAMWNANGIPSSLDIDFTITDLYESMSITKTDATNWKYSTVNNTALMDYIANFCGINIYKPEIGRAISIWFVNNFANRASDFISTNMWGNLRNSIANAIVNIYRNGN